MFLGLRFFSLSFFLLGGLHCFFCKKLFNRFLELLIDRYSDDVAWGDSYCPRILSQYE
jgi:hypothetical protein